MHELAMATSIMESILNVANKNEAISVTEVVLEVGELTMLNPEQLRFMMDVIRKDTIMKDAEIIINMVPIEVECPKCKYRGVAEPDEHMDHLMAIAICPECGQTNLNILKGQECNVKTIKIEREDENA